LEEKIKKAVEGIPGVTNCHQIRIRQAGPDTFIDAHVLLDGSLSLNDAHAMTEKIEKVIQKISPSADVTVHPEPIPVKPEKDNEVPD
jgi:ferrous-iron efflux pump FieF